MDLDRLWRRRHAPALVAFLLQEETPAEAILAALQWRDLEPAEVVALSGRLLHHAYRDKIPHGEEDGAAMWVRMLPRDYYENVLRKRELMEDAHMAFVAYTYATTTDLSKMPPLVRHGRQQVRFTITMGRFTMLVEGGDTPDLREARHAAVSLPHWQYEGDGATFRVNLRSFPHDMIMPRAVRQLVYRLLELRFLPLLSAPSSEDGCVGCGMPAAAGAECAACGAQYCSNMCMEIDFARRHTRACTKQRLSL